MMSRRLFAMLLLLGGVASAQDAYMERWQAARAGQPAGVSFEISSAKTEFYTGELIPLQLSFTSTEGKSFLADSRLQDRVGRMNGVEEFLVDPGTFDDPLHGLPGETGGMGGLSGGPLPLSEKPFTFERLLNEWVHFRKPGKYRIAILSRRVTQGSPSAPRVELTSNIVTIDIVPAPAAWVKQQIAEAAGILDSPIEQSEEARQRRLRAGRTLRFLESREASFELVRHLSSGNDVDSWSLYMGALGSPYRKELLPFMEARLVAPDQPVWDRYLDTLARMSELTGGQSKRKEYVSRLIASLPVKQPEARIVSIGTLMDAARRDDGDTPWLARAAASVIADFRALSPKLQLDLLEGRWSMIASPAMLPILREMYAAPADTNPRLREIAARRIYELAPEEGRQILLSELARPNADLSPPTLELLPDRKLPDLNDPLASRLEAGQYVDTLILRYATGDVVQRVERAYLRRNEEQDRRELPHCSGPLVYYFLQYDPPFGERELRNDMNRPDAFGACYDIGFQFRSLGASAYSPALERLAIEFLSSPKVPVKRGAAEVLGKYGSPAAEKPLWEALEYFRSWWKGREEQLAHSEENMQLERALRVALAQAGAWLLQDQDLNRLLDLCSSNWCRQELEQWLPLAAQPVAIQVTPGSGGFQATVAQYEIHSEEQMRRKLQQYPAGTAFRLPSEEHAVPQYRAAIQRAGQIVRSAGYAVAAQ
jgi:hypothetical protein